MVGRTVRCGGVWIVAGLLAAILAGLQPVASPALAQQQADEALKHRLLKGLKGTDDRRLVDSIDYPWSAVGRVNRRTGGFCTGTVIAPSEVLTAAHCVWNPRTRDWLPPSSLDFLAGYRRGDYLAHRKVISITLADRTVTPDSGEAPFRPNDWAVLRLDDPVDHLTGTLPLAPADLAPQGFAQVGYSQDKPHMLTLDDGCRVEAWRSGMSLQQHWCDAVHGDSGSPVLAYAADGMYVAAMHVATLVRGAERIGLAVPAAAIRAARPR